MNSLRKASRGILFWQGFVPQLLSKPHLFYTSKKRDQSWIHTIAATIIFPSFFYKKKYFSADICNFGEALYSTQSAFGELCQWSVTSQIGPVGLNLQNVFKAGKTMRAPHSWQTCQVFPISLWALNVVHLLGRGLPSNTVFWASRPSPSTEFGLWTLNVLKQHNSGWPDNKTLECGWLNSLCGPNSCDVQVVLFEHWENLHMCLTRN